jgi:hypothetical protein
MSDDFIEPLDETGRWRARDVSYCRGVWEKLKPLLPTFTMEEFRASDKTPPNPYMRSVIRQPRSLFEQPIPVGVVSNTYGLSQHAEVVEQCLAGIKGAGIRTQNLTCEIGLTELGEWMNLRIYFPEQFQHRPLDDEPLGLRLECFNSVDGTSRLLVLLGWLRFVCSNGMVIGETKTELRDVHNQDIDLAAIPKVIQDGLQLVKRDIGRLQQWQQTNIGLVGIEEWADEPLAGAWGKKAACRVFHICESGEDVEITDPFAKVPPTKKPWKVLQAVPGAPSPAKTIYDVSQALSWVASKRNNPEERVAWQAAIPRLIDRLSAA